jgi:hypothetical protein
MNTQSCDGECVFTLCGGGIYVTMNHLLVCGHYEIKKLQQEVVKIDLQLGKTLQCVYKLLGTTQGVALFFCKMC